MDHVPFGVLSGRFLVVVWVCRVKGRLWSAFALVIAPGIGEFAELRRTVWCMFLYNLHKARNSRHFAVGVVKESVVALLHLSDVIPC